MSGLLGERHNSTGVCGMSLCTLVSLSSSLHAIDSKYVLFLLNFYLFEKVTWAHGKS